MKLFKVAAQLPVKNTELLMVGEVHLLPEIGYAKILGITSIVVTKDQALVEGVCQPEEY